MSTTKKRLNFYMDAKICAKVDAFADELGLDRSSAICYIVGYYFQQREQQALASDMLGWLTSPDGRAAIAAAQSGAAFPAGSVPADLADRVGGVAGE